MQLHPHSPQHRKTRLVSRLNTLLGGWDLGYDTEVSMEESDGHHSSGSERSPACFVERREFRRKSWDPTHYSYSK